MKDLLFCVHVVIKTLNLEISFCYLAAYFRELYKSMYIYAARLFFLMQSIRSLFSDIVIAVAVVHAQAPW